jgi:hypothetical protein
MTDNAALARKLVGDLRALRVSTARLQRRWDTYDLNSSPVEVSEASTPEHLAWRLTHRAAGAVGRGASVEKLVAEVIRTLAEHEDSRPGMAAVARSIELKLLACAVERSEA